MDPLDLVAPDAPARRHRLARPGSEGAVGAVVADDLRAARLLRDEQPVTASACNVLATVGERRGGVLHALRLRAAVLPEPRRGRRAPRARHLRRQGHPGRAVRGGRTAARRRRDARRPAVRGRRGAGQRRRDDRQQHRRRSRGFWSTASRPTAGSALATRGVLRVRLHANGRAAHSGYPQLGESAIEKLLDALHRRCGRGAAGRSGARPHALQHRLDQRRRRAERDSRPTPRPRCCSARSARTTRCGRCWSLRWPAGSSSRRCSNCRRCGCTRCLDSRPRSSPTSATFRSSTNWGTPLLLGPGHPCGAHRREHVAIADLERAVDLYADLAARLLAA